MRLVYVVPFQPYPPHDGASIRIWHTLRGLGRRNEVHLVVQGSEPEGWALRELYSVAATVTFVPLEASRRVPGARGEGRLATFLDMCTYPPSYLRRYRSGRLVAAVRDLISGAPRTDWLLCDTQLSGQIALSAGLPPVRRSLCLYDLYDEWYARKVEHTPPGRFRRKIQFDRLKARRYETRIMRAFDLLTAVSEDDRAGLKRRVPGMPVAVVPSGVDVEYFQPRHEPGDASHSHLRILFTGKLSYEPNADGVRYFLDEVWPHLRRKEPGAAFVAAGMHPPAWLVSRGHDDPSVVVTGAVDDMRPIFAGADVAVVPLRLGAGTKLKVLEALAMGVPVVTTPEGCAGIEARDGEHLLVGASAPELANQILRVARDPGLKVALATAGRALVTERYGWSGIMDRYEATLREFGERYTDSARRERVVHTSSTS